MNRVTYDSEDTIVFKGEKVQCGVNIEWDQTQDGLDKLFWVAHSIMEFILDQKLGRLPMYTQKGE